MRPRAINMSKTRRWVIILLSLLALILIGLNLANTDDTAQPEVNLTTLRIKRTYRHRGIQSEGA